MKKLLLVLLGTACIAVGSQAQTDILWEDNAPEGGNMMLTLVTNAFGSGIGEFDTTGLTQYRNYNNNGQDWSSYAGKDWTLSVDVYITAAALTDPNVADDTIYINVGIAGSAGFTAVSNLVGDTWNTLTWNGTFDANPAVHVSSTAMVLNNSNGTDPAAPPNYYLDNFKLEAEAIPQDCLWEDNAPSGGSMMLTLVTNAFGTGIGEFDSSTGGAFQNHNPGPQDWSAYAGKGWTLSYDIYIPGPQGSDTNVTDDSIYYSVGGVSGGWTDVSTLPTGVWHTVTWSGTFINDEIALTNANALAQNADQGTHPAGPPNYYVDNYKFTADALPKDCLWEDNAPSGGMFTLVTNAFGTGIGEFDSTINTNDFENYGVYGQDWSAYAGKAWTFTFDIYLTAAQLAEATINDDQYFYQVAGVSGGWNTISNSSFAPDEWNTVTWTGTFDSDPNALTNVFARILNNDWLTHPGAPPNYYADNFKLEAVAPPKDCLWVDYNPEGGNIELTLVTNAFGVGIGEFESVGLSQFRNYNSGEMDLSDYAGLGWTLSFDVYVTTEQVTDSAIGDDGIYYNVAGVAGGWTDVSNLTANAWNSFTFTGTFDADPNALTNANILVLNNSMNTHPASNANYWVDNYKFEAVSPEPEPQDVLWEDQNPVGGNMELVSTNDIFGTGRGNIGCFDSTGLTQWRNYNSGTQNLKTYAGKDWTLSVEVYITAAAAGDTNVTDDAIYINVDGAAEGWIGVDTLIPDSWNKLTWTGTFSSDPNALTNVNALILNTSETTHPTSPPNYYVDNYLFTADSVPPPAMDTLWDDQNPVGGNMQLVSTNDIFSTGHGNIGCWDSTGLSQYRNYNSGLQNWSAYAGKSWTLSVDVYITAAAAGDTNVTDDTIYYNVGGVGGGWTGVDTLIPDQWNTLTWSGTFNGDPNALTNVNASVLNNSSDAMTHPLSPPNYYVDNYKLTAEAIPPPPMDVLWDDQAPVGGNMLLVQTNDLFGTGMGDIGCFDSTSGTADQYRNYSTNDVDWSYYAGQAWTLSVDVYITAAAAADPNIVDDTIYINVAGAGAAGWTGVNTLVPDEWNTLTWSGTFSGDPNALTNTSALVLNNNNLTDPASNANYYVDNYYLSAVTPTGPVDPYDTWADAYGLMGADALPGADPDLDGVNNLGEYGLNGDPTDDQDQGHIILSIAGGTATYTHAALLNDTNVTYTVETAGDLSTGIWTPIGAGSTSPLNADYEEWMYFVPSTPSEIFFRITVGN